MVIDIKNTISWGNKATVTGNDVCVTDGTVRASYSNIGEVYINSGTYNDNGGNINEDPLFANPDIGDYHLTPCSPCIDTGTNDVELSLDYEGDTRSFDGDGDNVVTTDIGADEYTRPGATNVPPVADAGPDQSGIAGETMIFDGSASYDPDGTIESYDWDFGDGTTASGIIVSHVYEDDGLYEVTLTITDDQGTWCSDTTQVETGCTYSISPESRDFDKEGGEGSVSVTAADSCDWTASSSAPLWLNIISGNNGTGDGAVNYSVSPNTGASSRTGTITVTGDTLKTFKVNQSGVGEYPAPDINASSSDGPITSGTSNSLSVSVSLAAGGSSGIDCDWWVVADTPFGWFYFDAGAMNWTYAGSSYTDLSPTYQGSLFNLSSFEVLNMTDLPVGTYTFYFAVDTNMNGILDTGTAQLYYDSVVVNITP